MDSVRRDAWTHGANGASRGRGRRFPLGALILRYFAYVLAALLALALVAYAAFGVLVGSGTVLLANYGDTALDETSAQLAALPSADADAIDAAVPSAYRWALFSPDGAYAAGDVAAGAVDDARAAAFDGLAIDYETFGMTRYEPVTLADGSVCVLVYQYLPQFASKDLRDALPNPQNLLLGALAVLSVLTLVGIAARAARVISRKMEPLADAVRRIEERDLDFEVASSRVREIDDVLAAMDDMRASLKDSLEAQWRGEQAQREQIAALAHDLKTPLASVIGYLNLLRDERELSAELEEKYLSISLEKAERLEELINEFFEIARFNLSNIPLQYGTISLNRLLEQLVFEFKPMLQEKGLDCSIRMEEEIKLSCDADKMQRVFDNLLRNAVFYSFENTTVHIVARRENDRVRIQFINHGQTIPEEKLNRIFEQFYRLDASRGTNRGGAGLGLAIAKEIIELHKGSITAESEKEQIRFEVSLPDRME